MEYQLGCLEINADMYLIFIIGLLSNMLSHLIHIAEMETK